MSEVPFEKREQGRPQEQLELIGHLSNGERVFDRPRSHLHQNPSLLKNLPEALLKIDPEKREFFIETVDFGREIGVSNCIETKEEDEVVYAQRVGRFGMSRFVKNRTAEPSSQITVILKKIPEGYITISGFVGPKAEREPWDAHADKNSIPFWRKHAIIYGTEQIIPGTETKKCPW